MEGDEGRLARRLRLHGGGWAARLRLGCTAEAGLHG
jgi:hypothetical protein